MALVKATLKNISTSGAQAIPVMFNPDNYTITTNMLYPDISVPGLRSPLIQFVRGEAQTLAVELFLDQSQTGKSLTEKLDELRTFVKIDSELHAPPICEFAWGDTSFQGVMIEFSEKFQMFDAEGKVLRCRVTIKMKRYDPANLQSTDLNRQSPDRTKTRAIRSGDRLDLIAAEEYGDPAQWRFLAAANAIDRPRQLIPGTMIEVPPL
ncbi:MAG: hypothetical protein ACRCS9_15670 [Hyphomicrobium sp.]